MIDTDDPSDEELRARAIIAGVHFDLCRGRRRTKMKIRTESALKESIELRGWIESLRDDAQSNVPENWDPGMPAPAMMWAAPDPDATARCQQIWTETMESGLPSTEFMWLFTASCDIAHSLLADAEADYILKNSPITDYLDPTHPSDDSGPGFWRSLSIVMKAFSRAKSHERLR